NFFSRAVTRATNSESVVLCCCGGDGSVVVAVKIGA
ncbi:hypothetical protein Tco_0574603, partial [Tanacetum coccineum]